MQTNTPRLAVGTRVRCTCTDYAHLGTVVADLGEAGYGVAWSDSPLNQRGPVTDQGALASWAKQHARDSVNVRPDRVTAA